MFSPSRRTRPLFGCDLQKTMNEHAKQISQDILYRLQQRQSPVVISHAIDVVYRRTSNDPDDDVRQALFDLARSVDQIPHNMSVDDLQRFLQQNPVDTIRILNFGFDVLTSCWANYAGNDTEEPSLPLLVQGSDYFVVYDHVSAALDWLDWNYPWLPKMNFGSPP